MPLAVTLPNLKNVPWRHCSRWDEQPAAQLAKSFLRLGVCQSQDWSGSAVDFVERGFKRFCAAHCLASANEIWDLNLQITDHQFDLTEQQRQEMRAESNAPLPWLYLIADFGSACPIPVAPTLQLLEREHEALPAAFYRVLVDSLEKWMDAYHYGRAVEHAEMWMEGMEDEELRDSVYPKVKGKLPPCLAGLGGLSYEEATKLLKRIAPRLRSRVTRQLVESVLEMHRHGQGREQAWPGRLVSRVPGLEDFLNDTDGCIPGCVVSWHADDEIVACFDEEANTMGQNGFLCPCAMLLLPLTGSGMEIDAGVGAAIEHLAAMLSSLASAAKTIEIIGEIVG